MICPLRNKYRDGDIIVRTVRPGRAHWLARNTADTHHKSCLLDGFSAQATVSSGYKDRADTKEDICSDLANSLPSETLHRGGATSH